MGASEAFAGAQSCMIDFCGVRQVKRSQWSASSRRRTSLGDAPAGGPTSGGADAEALVADARAKTAAARRAVRTAMAVFKSAGCDAGSLTATFSKAGVERLPGCDLKVTAADVGKAEAAAAAAKYEADEAQQRAEIEAGLPAGDPVSATGYDRGRAIPAGYPVGTSSNLGGLAPRAKTRKPQVALPQEQRPAPAAPPAPADSAAPAPADSKLAAEAPQAYPEGGVGAGLWAERDRAAGAIGMVEAESRQSAWRVPSLAPSGRDKATQALAPKQLGEARAPDRQQGGQGAFSVRAGVFEPW